jgi:hypothetical protein
MGGKTVEGQPRPATAPSSQYGGDPELDIDKAMERLNQSRNAAMARAAKDAEDEELDVDEEELTHADDAPEDDDFEDDDEESDEVDTPDDEDEDEEETSLESTARKQKQPGTPPAPRKGKASTSDSEEDDEGDVKLSRKQRGKLIEEMRQQILKTEQEKAQLAERQKLQQEEDERLAKEVQRALGSEEEYEKAMEEGLQGDETQAERARIWKSNRAFFNKLVKQAERRVQSSFTASYWETVQKLPGVDMQILSQGSLGQVLQHIYEAGANSIEGESQKRIETLEDEVETWKGRYRSLKAKAGGTKRSPVGAGGEPVSDKKVADWRKRYLGKDGLPTDEAETLVLQGGFEKLLQPSKRKVR